jgi:hypothetical protein
MAQNYIVLKEENIFMVHGLGPFRQENRFTNLIL